MDLDPPLEPPRLYVAVAPDVNSYRPWFTGDIWDNVQIAGVGDSAAMIIGHPCSIRGKGGKIADHLPVVAIEEHNPVPDDNWATGYYNRMPLKGLPLPGAFHVARFDQIGLAPRASLSAATRIADLQHLGINQLQQRLVFHFTRAAMATKRFQEAFHHTYSEADLIEEWMTELHPIDPDPERSFGEWMGQGSPSRLDKLRDFQERAPIQREMNTEIGIRKATAR